MWGNFFFERATYSDSVGCSEFDICEYEYKYVAPGYPGKCGIIIIFNPLAQIIQMVVQQEPEFQSCNCFFERYPFLR